jgi:hypothetical protein
MTVIQPPGKTMDGKFTTNKTKLCLWNFHPQSSTSRNKISWEFHVDDLSESSSTYDMIIDQGKDLLGELGIIMNFNDHTVTWDTDTVPIKDRDTYTLSSVETLIEVYMIANEPQTLIVEYSRAIKFLC